MVSASHSRVNVSSNGTAVDLTVDPEFVCGLFLSSYALLRPNQTVQDVFPLINVFMMDVINCFCVPQALKVTVFKGQV